METFDWISPLVAFIQDWINRPSTGFRIPAGDDTLSGYEVKEHLERHGIKTWGWMKAGDTIIFRVRSAQGEYADYLLAQLGLGAPDAGDERVGWQKAKRKARRSRKKGRGKVSVRDAILDFIGV